MLRQSKALTVVKSNASVFGGTSIDGEHADCQEVWWDETIRRETSENKLRIVKAA